MTHLAAAILAAALLLSAQGVYGVALNPPPVLGSTYAFTYITGDPSPTGSLVNDGTLSTATFSTFALGKVTSNYYQWEGKARAVVDGSSRLWFLDQDYLRRMDFAGDSVTTVFPALGAAVNVLSCNGAGDCGPVGICGADAGWTTLYISTSQRTIAPTYSIIALNLATLAYTSMPVPDHPWDCLVNATSPSSGTIYISVNGGIQTLDLATQVVSSLTQVLPHDFTWGYSPPLNWVDGPLASAQFGPYNSLALGDGAQLFLADPVNKCLRLLDTAARTVTTISGDPTVYPPFVSPTLPPVAVASALWFKPMSVVWDSARQLLYVVCALVM